ncbi:MULTISPECIES: hypothetical protein [unclassified Rhizobium]|uniref:hypothetical protein n=1 Tax=unclassified Rhizobium TaxID=2613769 RepID=UPI0007010CF2|nr:MULTISPECIES: hypothetical protein [unclassified Rhizobium]KQV35561.1 hypothetical protein ASC86_10100 [Rhizobium sp. Root1212]KRD25667.1 hypothetical protein ASE37_10095 [Rhizobium sp. Root268]
MLWSYILSTLYGAVVLLFLDSSFREGELAGGEWDMMRVLGLLACLVWPLLIVYVILSAFRQKQFNRRTR